MMFRRVVVVLLLVALLGGTWCFFAARTPKVPAYLARMGGDFTVQSAAGSVRLSDMRGKVVLLYFGYSHCPDVCPATLNVMAAAMRLLHQDEQEQVQGLFVSLDPYRDTPEKLQQYVQFFGAKIIGATATRAVLDGIAAQWRFSYHVPEHPKSAFYVVSHPNFLYVVNRKGELAALLDEKNTPEDVVKEIRKW